MLNALFRGLFDTDMTQVISVSHFLLCLVWALLLGLLLAGASIYRTQYSRSFVMTLAMLPAAVCIVIMMVNGNVGAGVAVAGAFNLVRFRSVPGNAREIAILFLAMGAGLICGMGYLGFALLFTVLMCAVCMLYTRFDFGAARTAARYQTLTITIPENLDYTGVFDDIFARYTTTYELTHAKTVDMGSLFRLTYSIVLRDAAQEKQFVDELRCRNGNLEIALSRRPPASESL